MCFWYWEWDDKCGNLGPRISCLFRTTQTQTGLWLRQRDSMQPNILTLFCHLLVSREIFQLVPQNQICMYNEETIFASFHLWTIDDPFKVTVESFKLCFILLTFSEIFLRKKAECCGQLWQSQLCNNRIPILDAQCSSYLTSLGPYKYHLKVEEEKQVKMITILHVILEFWFKICF